MESIINLRISFKLSIDDPASHRPAILSVTMDTEGNVDDTPAMQILHAADLVTKILR